MKKCIFQIMHMALIIFFIQDLYGNQLDLKLVKKTKIDDSKSPIIAIYHLVYDNNANIFILDGVNLIKKYDENGKYIDTIIKNGLGPNELQFVQKLNINKDASRLIVYDHNKNKIMLFDLSGQLFKQIDTPTIRWPKTISTVPNGEYDLYLMEKTGELSLCRLNESFEVKKYYLQYDNKWNISDIGFYTIWFDYDDRGNIYVINNVEYLIYKYNNNMHLTSKYSSPGKYYIKCQQIPRKKIYGDEFAAWLNSFSTLSGCYVINKNYLLICYRNMSSKKISKYYFDIYNLNGKRVLSGCFADGLRPVGKDNKGRLVCAKTDISGDGTDVAYWLYIYSVNQSKLK